MPAFDASALVPLFDAAHPRHDEARRRFREARQVLLHPCTVAEMTMVVRRIAKDHGRNGNKVARQALSSLLEQPRVRIEASLDYEAAVAMYLDTNKLSFTDAVVAQMRHHHDRKAPVTFDDDLL